MTGAPTNQEKLLKPGMVIAERYEVVAALGSGGMGEVYQVRDLELRGEPLALKILHKDLSRDEVTFDRFRNEVLLARTLSHANIVRIHDLVRAPEGFYFVTMEYVEGESLSSLITRLHGERAGLPLRAEQVTELIFILRELLGAIGFAHKRGIIHRDIKPHNVLRAADGSVKLADFGTARLVSAASELTPTGQVVGTPYYMSPEQIRGEDLDGRSDLYAVGIMAFEMFSGNRPFKGENFVSIVFKHLQEPLPSLNAELSGAPPWLDSVLRTATHKDREMRFKSAEQFAAALSTPSDVKRGTADDKDGATPVLQSGSLSVAPPDAESPPSRSGWWAILAALAIASVGGIYYVRHESFEIPSRADRVSDGDEKLALGDKKHSGESGSEKGDASATEKVKEPAVSGVDSKAGNGSTAEEIGRTLGVPEPELPAVEDPVKPLAAESPAVLATGSAEQTGGDVQARESLPSTPALVTSDRSDEPKLPETKQPEDDLDTTPATEIERAEPTAVAMLPERKDVMVAPPVVSPVKESDLPVTTRETSELPPAREVAPAVATVARTAPVPVTDTAGSAVSIFFRNMNEASPIDRLQKRGAGDFRWTAIVETGPDSVAGALTSAESISLCLFDVDRRGGPTICSRGSLLSSSADELRVGGTLSRETLKTLSRGSLTAELRAGQKQVGRRSIELAE